MSEVALDRLLSTRVLARDGRSIGRIEEVRAERDGTRWRVSEYHVGTAALLQRLSARLLPRLLHHWDHGWSVRWDQLDLTDPDRPRLACPIEELRRFTRPAPPPRKRRTS